MGRKKLVREIKTKETSGERERETERGREREKERERERERVYVSNSVLQKGNYTHVYNPCAITYIVRFMSSHDFVARLDLSQVHGVGGGNNAFCFKTKKKERERERK